MSGRQRDKQVKKLTLTPPHSLNTPRKRNKRGKNLEKSILSISLLNVALDL